MKAPDLAVIDDSGVHEWSGSVDPLKASAKEAKLGFALVDLRKAKDKATLFAELDRALALPDHFGHNWDALADVLEGLRRTYSGTIAYEVEHIANHAERTWLREAIETGRYRSGLKCKERRRLLARLAHHRT